MFKLNYWKLAISIVACQLAGVIGSFATSSSVTTWYPELIKPTFNPPSWLFAPVWIILYALMGVALYMVWDKGIKTKQSKWAIKLFGFQLGLNSLWSVLFFGLKNPLLAFLEIIILWTAILLMIMAFRRISKPAAYLLIPYILWVSFAAILNFSLFYLNM